jgi:hypothetical protein
MTKFTLRVPSHSVHSRGRGNQAFAFDSIVVALGPRFRGDERVGP